MRTIYMYNVCFPHQDPHCFGIKYDTFHMGVSVIPLNTPELFISLNVVVFGIIVFENQAYKCVITECN